MKLVKNKVVPQILFEKDLPQLQDASKDAINLDSTAVVTMFLLATMLTFISWFVLVRMFREDFIENNF